MASIPPYTFFQCPCANPPSEEDEEEGEVDDDDGAATEIATPTSPRTPPPPPPPLPADASSSSLAFSTSFATDLTGDGSSSAGVGVGAGASSSAAATAAAFDPRAPRANYSLYPLEHLLYCDDCHQIRCPRCVSEEMVTYFCPSCLFEVPSSNLRTEGNRCTRSCFQCPVCTGPLAVTALEPAPAPDRGLLAAPGSGDPTAAAPALYVLACSYCQWSSSEIGVRFDKPNGIYAQLARVRHGHGNGGLGGGGGGLRRGGREISSAAISQVPLPEEEPDETAPHHPEAVAAAAELDDDPDMRFAALKAFYSAQMAESAPQAPGALSSLGEYGYSSPSSVQRLMSLYTASRSSLPGGGGGLRKGARRPPAGMREADSAEEGLRPASLDESAAIDRLLRSSWEDTVSREQAGEQVGAGPRQRHDPSRFRDELRPVPCLLRTKRSKRCPACRHIITKPEAKVSNTRFRIRLVAANYIPTISIRALPASAIPATPGAPAPAPAPQSQSSHPHPLLQPLRSVLYIVKFRNPIFENVRVTLATPAATPGRFPSRVTVLCPQFEIDANTDMWDDALKEEHPRAGGVGPDGGGGGDDKGSAGRFDDGSRHQVEAGKVWDRGRNWVSIILEVIPAAIGGRPAAGTGDSRGLREDEDLVEIPMFVRLEWEYDPQADMVAPPHSRGREGKEKRELAYWCVLGIGRISREETGR